MAEKEYYCNITIEPLPEGKTYYRKNKIYHGSSYGKEPITYCGLDAKEAKWQWLNAVLLSNTLITCRKCKAVLRRINNE